MTIKSFNVDKIQKAPNLLEYIKIMCDESEERGRFWLTGSQRKKLMEKSQETLAGRLGILKLCCNSYSKLK